MASKLGLVALILGCSAGLPAGAAVVPYLVKDIDPIPFPASSSPGGVVPFGGIDLFAADDGVHGRELWRTNGTAAGTYELADSCPGKCWGFPSVFAVTGHSAFFLSGGDLWVTRGTPHDTFDLARVRDARHPVWVASRGLLFFFTVTGLWRSDGTAAGTYPLSDVTPDSDEMVELQGFVYFTGRTGLHGSSLLRSDGTPGGTVLLWDPAPGDFSHDPLRMLRVLGRRLLFVAPGPGGDPALWSSDGTSHPPALVTSPSSEHDFRDAVVFAGRLLLVAETETTFQLWASDGTAAGTRLLKSFASPHAFPLSGFSAWASLPGRFLFTVDDGVHGAEPWVTDGTPAGTHLLKDICPGSCSGAVSFFQYPGSVAYFSATDPSLGQELWITDGTSAGTRLVRDLCPGKCSGSPSGLQAAKGKIVFAANAADGRSVIWRTDGTPQGTVRVTDLGPGTSIDSFGYPIPGGLLFVATEPVHGTEIWRTDGTAAGTAIVKDIASADLAGSAPQDFMAAGGKAFFLANDGSHGFELWTSDGTGGGTRLAGDLAPGQKLPEAPIVRAFTEAAGNLFFLTLSTRQRPFFDLWRSDGTPAGTFLVNGVTGMPATSELCGFAGAIFYAGVDELMHPGLWKTDGTVAGTQLVTDKISNLGYFTVFHGRLFFSARDGASGQELWASDGTAEGTVLVKDINVSPGGSSYPSRLTEHDGFLYFFADDGDEHGRKLWRSDGTTEGTTLVADLVPRPDSFAVEHMMSVGSLLFILGRDEAGRGLWSSDGTAAGTHKVVALPAGPADPDAPYDPLGRLAAFQGRFYFVPLSFGGLELWVSDGTAAGTGPVLAQNGQPVGAFGLLRALSRHLYFRITGIDGSILWQTDGTQAGTLPVAGSPDISRDYEPLLSVGGRLFFAGWEPLKGQELWALGPD
jgi:ELWxxDGT repeat protein